MSTGTQIIRTALPELRARYAKRLRTQTGELLDFISRCERGRLTEEICRDAQILAHSLCGTGSTFGFPEISDAARYLENALDCGPPHDAQNYIQLTLALIRACDVAADRTAQPSAEAVAHAQQPQAEEVERPLLLVVNGDDATMAIMQELFNARMNVLHTADNDEALQLLATRHPAVVIFDIQGTASSAAVPLEKLYIQAHAQNVSVIVLAPTRQAAAVAHAISAGAIQCIMKPVSFEKLYTSTRATVERGRLVVLLGDDDVIVREMMANRFKTHGFSVVGANDGAQILDLAARHRPSIIVLDRIMPGLEGLVVLQMLKSNPMTHEIPVIMLTTKRKANEITEARRAGAADYIVKPFTPDRVVVRCMHELGLAPTPELHGEPLSFPLSKSKR